MKKSISIIVLLLFGFGAIIAQENKTIKEESVVKRVVTKEGSTVAVKEVKEVQTEKGTVVIAGDETENQEFSEQTRKEDSEQVLLDEEMMNSQNEAEKAAIEKRKAEELQKSKEAAMAKAEAERKKLAELEAARLQALEENKKQLEKRGKGIVKLKKKGN